MRSREGSSALTVISENVSIPDKRFCFGGRKRCLSLYGNGPVYYKRAGSGVSRLITFERFVSRYPDEPRFRYVGSILNNLKCRFADAASLVTAARRLRRTTVFLYVRWKIAALVFCVFAYLEDKGRRCRD